jgi:hypothetical protein
MRIGYLFVFLTIIVILYISIICRNGLVENGLPDNMILILSTLIYFSMMAGYTYYHFDEFYKYSCQINKWSLLLLIVMASLMFTGNIIFHKVIF